MKDHQIAELVNILTAEVKRISPDSPQCLRSVISRSVTDYISRGGTRTESIDFPTHMKVCFLCGYKRCPHATNEDYACTGSNEPNQKGSSY